MMAALCEHYSIGPAQVRESTFEEVNALVRRMSRTLQELSNAG